MKWAAGILALMLYLVWPYYTLLELAQAIKSGDAATINHLVDWNPVRTSFKAQLQAHLEKMPKSAAEVENPGLATLGNAFALTVANSFIDKLLTPEGISRVIQISREKHPQGAKLGGKLNNQETPKNDLYKRIKFAFFVSPVNFRLDLKTASNHQIPTDDQTLTVMLTFKGNGWQVTDLRLPASNLTPKLAQAVKK